MRVPKSKVSEYREAIKKLVDEKSFRDTRELTEGEEDNGSEEKETVVFRDFREFGKNTGEEDKGKNGEEDDFIDSVFKEVERLRKNNKESK